MPSVDVSCSHRLSRLAALERTKELATTVTESLFPLTWTCMGDDIDFHAAGILHGRASVTEGEVLVRIRFPFALAWLRRLVTARLTEALEVYLYPLEQSPLSGP